jgi:hypothetical protein
MMLIVYNDVKRVRITETNEGDSADPPLSARLDSLRRGLTTRTE